MSFLNAPSFAVRTDEDEQMDDFSIDDERLTDALQQLRIVNQYLSGYSTTMSILKPYLRSRTHTRILDVGTGIADFPEHIVRWADRHLPAHQLEVVAIDANPVTVAYAQRTLKARLPSHLAARIRARPSWTGLHWSQVPERPATRARIAGPYRSILAGPMPLTWASSAVVVGRISAMAARVASTMTV